MKYHKKTRFQSDPIAALCLYNIQRENLVIKNSLCIISDLQIDQKSFYVNLTFLYDIFLFLPKRLLKNDLQPFRR